MSSKNRKEAMKNTLSASGGQRLKSFEHRIQKCQIAAQQKGWNYNDFVAYLLEIIVVLRLRDKQKSDLQQK
jgi:hypothetical protein